MGGASWDGMKHQKSLKLNRTKYRHVDREALESHTSLYIINLISIQTCGQPCGWVENKQVNDPVHTYRYFMYIYVQNYVHILYVYIKHGQLSPFSQQIKLKKINNIPYDTICTTAIQLVILPSYSCCFVKRCRSNKESLVNSCFFPGSKTKKSWMSRSWPSKGEHLQKWPIKPPETLTPSQLTISKPCLFLYRFPQLIVHCWFGARWFVIWSWYPQIVPFHKGILESKPPFAKTITIRWFPLI